MHILIVEDDPRLVRMLDRGLTEEGYSVSAVGDGNRGLAALGSGGFDACILDVRLPGIDGFEILERARAQGVATPVILLTARDAVPDRVHGLRIGADDYLTKPFAFAELVARLQARTRGRGAAERCLRCGPIELDTAEHRVTVAGQRVELSARQFSLLEYLLFHCGQVVSRPMLLRHVFGYTFDPGTNIVDVHVRHLRQRLGPAGAAHLAAVRGVGYRMTDEER